MADLLTPIGPAALRPGATQRILPAGRFRATDGRPEGLDSWSLDTASASRLIAAHPVEARVIDYEHQTLHKEKNGQPAPAAGWFKGLVWREGEGLFISEIEWTTKAIAMILSKEYRYLSPVFGFDPTTGVVTAIYHVALTNDPALRGLTDLVAASALLPSTPPADTQTMNEEDRAKFKHIFGFEPETHVAAAAAQPAADSEMSAEDRAKFIHQTGFTPEELKARFAS